MVNEGNSSSVSDVDNVSRPPRILFLALIMLASCIISCFLLYAVFQSRKVRYSVQSVTILNLVVVCLGDCFLNMSLVMGSLAAGSDWKFDTSLCKWHSFVMNFVLVETVLLLTVLACDRFLAVKFLQKYDSLMSPTRLGFVIVFTWIQSLAFSIPFFFNTIETTFRPKLHTCSVSDETPLAFICLASVLCFLAPAVIILIMFILIVRENYKQHHEVKTIITQNHYTDQLMEEPRLWKEMLTVKYVGVLCLLWFILEFPYVITTYIQQYRLSSELTFSMDYPWGVDVAFIWMRFSFSAVFPCITFIWKKDLWQCCKECLICHRNNSVLDIQVKVKPLSKPASVKDLSNTVASKSKERDQPRTDPPSLLSFNVPVLFATSDGIHIESPHSEISDPDIMDVKSKDPTLKGRQLDIIGQTVEDGGLPEDTSDYDSINEVGFSSSQPLSARHIRGALETSSLPDLRTDGPNERGVSDSVCDYADSGLELSATAGSLRRKGIQSATNSSQEKNKTDFIAGDVPCVMPSSGQGGSNQIRPSCNDKNGSKVVDSDLEGSDVATGVECSPAVQHCAPSTLPKAQGRLKPLSPTRKTKTKATRSGQSRKRTSTKTDSLKSEGACDAVSKKKVTKGEKNRAESAAIGETVKPQGAKSSREGRGKSHKRTVTSDSEKALLGSNSSVEMLSLKTHASVAPKDKQTHY